MNAGWSAELILVLQWCRDNLTLPVVGVIAWVGMVYAVRSAGWPWPFNRGKRG